VAVPLIGHEMLHICTVAHIPFVQTGDVKASNGRFGTYKQTYSEAGLAQSRLWHANTMCITIVANIAETGILTFPACFPDSVIGFIADEQKTDVRFVEYTFRLLKRKLQYEATGSGRNGGPKPTWWITPFRA